MTDATYATVMDAVFAMDAYEHNPGAGKVPEIARR